jgi:2'-5' RNA ligase
MSDTTTALAFIIPDEFHDKINEIRSQQDRAYPRWMPHINFMFPFVSVDKFDDVHNELKNVGITNMDITFEGIGYFSQAKQVTFHLKPDLPSTKKLQAINKIICTTLHWVDSKKHNIGNAERLTNIGNAERLTNICNEFTPHCTLAQCQKKDLVIKEKELNEWFNKTFNGSLTVPFDRICMIKRSPESNDMMQIKNFILI